MNDDAVLLLSAFFNVAFFFSLIVAALVLRSLWRARRAEKLRRNASISSLPRMEDDGRPPA